MTWDNQVMGDNFPIKLVSFKVHLLYDVWEY